MLTLDTKIERLNRVGDAAAKRLKHLGIETAEDLLNYFPFRYDDFTRVTPIRGLKAGVSANVVGRVELIQNRRSFRRRMYVTEALVSDDGGSLKVVWFNQPFIAKNLRVGDRVSLAGKVEEGSGGTYLSSPSYEKIHSADQRGRNSDLRGTAIHTQGLVPNYHLTERLTQKQLRFFIKQAIGLAKELVDWLPAEIRKKWKLISLAEAIVKIHFPKNFRQADEAKRRLAFNELFLLQIQSRLIRLELESSRTRLIRFKEQETKKFVDSLPFKLTTAQRKAAWEILKDLGRQQPMSRLLEGDVGSGKTVVAAIAILNVVKNNKQAALLAPTEILARQHFDTLNKLFAGQNIKIALITRSEKKSNFESGIKNQESRKGEKKLDSKFLVLDSDVIIGTHALIQDKIKFNNLTLAIIDEQHRFGVEQRKTLVEKAGGDFTPHFLSMTATPIPRSLALALYGDLDISILNELPVGRKKIITKIVPEEKRQAAYKFINDQVAAGRQVFVICPLIDISDRLGVKSVKEEYNKLNEQIFPELPIGMLHGRMKSAEKEKTMKEFLDGKIKILVSTSVVEVGVDVPNASIMMIEGAERFGLAQLHQFRGRVGRSEHQSYCFLFSESDSQASRERLRALENNNDGFMLAKMDLKFRGAGEVYGTLQSGFPELKIASLFDYALMKEAREAAVILVEADKTLNRWPRIKELIENKAGQAHLE